MPPKPVMFFWMVGLLALAPVLAREIHLRSFLVSHLTEGPTGPGSGQYAADIIPQQRRSMQVTQATLFFGDSQTASLATSMIAPNAENFGVPGDTIDGLSGRLPSYNLANQKMIVIQIGINDLTHAPAPDLTLKYANLLALIPINTPITAIGVFPLTSTNNYDVTPATISRANRQIATACAQFTNCHFLDLAQYLGPTLGTLAPINADPDGLHLSTTGYQAITTPLRLILSQQPPMLAATTR